MDAFITANADYIGPRLAVGGDLDEASPKRARAQLRELVDQGITHILDLRIEYSDEELVAGLAPGISYLHLGVDDAGQRLPDEWFEAGTRWLDEALAQPDTRHWSTATWASTGRPRWCSLTCSTRATASAMRSTRSGVPAASR